MVRTTRWLLPVVLLLSLLGLTAPGHAVGDTAIVGTVYNPDGVPLAGVEVDLIDPSAEVDGNLEDASTTDSAGHYSFPSLESLETGETVNDWVLSVDMGPGDQRGGVYPLDSLVRGETNTVDVHLRRQVLVSGTVLPSPGETSLPSGKIYPSLSHYVADGDYWENAGADASYDPATGAYSIWTVPGSTYRLCFGGGGPLGCDGANFLEDADDLVVDSAVAGHDVQLGTFGTISGRVGWAGHPDTPLPDVGVSVSRELPGGVVFWAEVFSAHRTTDVDGSYSTRVLAGTYHVRFYAPDVGDYHYYPDSAPDEASAQDVVVAPDATTTVDSDLAIDKPALVNTSPPTFDGSPVSGQPVTVRHGGWLASSGPTPTRRYLYRWTRDDGTALGTAATYTPTLADEGHRLNVTISASAAGYVRTAVQIESPPVARGIVNVVPPTISGTPTSAMTVTARPGTWSPGGLTFGYRWLDNGVPIADATSRSFTIPSSMINHTLKVEVTASRAGMEPGVVTATTGRIGQTQIVSATPPTIAGQPTVGRALTGRAGTWNPRGTTLTPVRWFADGVQISGTTAWTFTPTAAQLGKTLTFRVKATFPTAVARYADSAATAPVAPGTITAPLPTVTGSPTVGSTLTAISGATKPATTTIHYQWFRGSTAISGATSSRYVPTLTDTGKRVKVVLTYSATGYTTLGRTSAPTAPVT